MSDPERAPAGTDAEGGADASARATAEASARARIRAGDPEAFAELYDAYARAVYNHAHRLTGDWSTAEEVMVHLFLIRPAPSPLLVTYGGDETAEFCRQSEDFLAAWTGAGNRGVSLPQPGANHFTAITGFASPDSILCRSVFELMGHRPEISPSAPASERRFGRLRGRPGDVPRFDREIGHPRPFR